MRLSNKLTRNEQKDYKKTTNTDKKEKFARKKIARIKIARKGCPTFLLKLVLAGTKTP